MSRRLQRIDASGGSVGIPVRIPHAGALSIKLWGGVVVVLVLIAVVLPFVPHVPHGRILWAFCATAALLVATSWGFFLAPRRFYLGIGVDGIEMRRWMLGSITLTPAMLTMAGIASGSRIFLWATVSFRQVTEVSFLLGGEGALRRVRHIVNEPRFAWDIDQGLERARRVAEHDSRQDSVAVDYPVFDVFIEFPVPAKYLSRADRAFQSTASDHYLYVTNCWWNR